ncbi:MAG: YqhA family protein [Burkholderiales bacterium]
MFERLFESALWNSRFVVVIAVVASMAAAIAIFYITTVDVWYAVVHIVGYADPALDAEARKALHDDTVTHIVEVVDGYLLATVMLIFALGLYELFVSDIDQAHGSRTSSKILVIENLDDLKTRLAKVILMILIVKLFEHAVKTKMETTLDLLYMGGSIALVGLALYLTHAAEAHGDAPAAHGAEGAKSADRH